MKLCLGHKERPLGLKWRSSMVFITSVVGFGIMTDLTAYSIIIPVVPFQLEKLGYSSVSTLTAWLLFAYSVALVLSSPILSWLSEKYAIRRSPLLWGLLSLVTFLVLFMEAPTYAVMVVARFIQGISSSAVWVVGLALLADTVPPEKVGQQLGLAMMGLTIGALAAPPIGGVLYGRFGFRAPFIFGIIFAAIDLLGRLLLIERKDALKWGHDPWSTASVTTGTAPDSALATPSNDKQCESQMPSTDTQVINEVRPTKLPERKIWAFVLTHSRTLVGLGSVLIYGIAYTGLEPTLSLRLQSLYGFDSTKVGLVILASAVAAVFSSPLSGWISDRFGVERITVICLSLAIPFYALMIIRGSLPFFIVCFAVANFMLAAIVSPLTAELADVVRNVNGIGYGHVYGFFNMAFGVGSAVGPLIAGQVYDHSRAGWTILLSYSCGLLFLCMLLNFLYMGEKPLLSRTSFLKKHS